MPTYGPHTIRLGDHHRLGPDPEPLGERYDVLLGREHPTHFGCSGSGASRRQAPHRARPPARRRAVRHARDLALR